MIIQRTSGLIFNYVLLFILIMIFPGLPLSINAEDTMPEYSVNLRNITISLGKFDNISLYNDPYTIGSKEVFSSPVEQIVGNIFKDELLKNGYDIGDSDFIISGVLDSTNITWQHIPLVTISLKLKNRLSGCIVYQRTFSRKYYGVKDFTKILHSSINDFIVNMPQLNQIHDQGCSGSSKM